MTSLHGMRRFRRAGTLTVVLTALTGAGSRAGAQQVNACYVPSVGAVYLVGLQGLPTGCLAPGHVPVTLGAGALADGAVTAAKLADGAVVTVKLADGAVTPAKLSFDPATQTELDALITALHASGTINAVSNLVDWTQLRNVPAGIADGVDNEATGGGTAADLACAGCVGNTDVADGAITTGKIAPGTSVDLLGGLGPTAFALATQVDALGTVGTINASTNPVDWSKLKGVPPGFADGVDDVGNFTASNPIAIVGTDIRLSAAACVAGEVWKWTGTLWDCVPDANSGGTVTSVTAGGGLLGGTITTNGTFSANFLAPGGDNGGAATTSMTAATLHETS